MEELPAFLSGLALQTVFLVSGAVMVHAFCRRWYTDGPVAVRWCAGGIVFCWMLSMLFAVLMSARQFAPFPATLAAVVGLALIPVAKAKLSGSSRLFAEDVSYFRTLFSRQGTAVWQLALASFLLLAALLTIRVLALPLLGWDTLTYHGLKTGMWIQTKGWTDLNAPGGWEYYRSYFGGGEVFTAWAMLFLRSDLFAGIPDVLFWGMLGLTTSCLARECGMHTRAAMLVGMAFLCAPDLSRMVGTGYVDTCASSFLLGGILFLVRYDRSKLPVELCVAAAAFGLASSVKVNTFATSMVVALPAIVLLLMSRRPPFKAYGVCVLCFAAPVVPWLLFDAFTTGFPLGGVPLSIGPIHLGNLPPSLAWFLDYPGLTPYTLSTEVRALLQALENFGFVLLLTALGIPGVLSGVGRYRFVHLLTLLLVAAVAAFYYSPSFTPVRLVWAVVNGRFLAPAVILVAAAGLPFLQRFRNGTLLIEAVSAVSIVIGLWSYIQKFVLNQHRVEFVFLATAALLAVLIYCALAVRGRFAFAKTTFGAIVGVGALVSALYLVARFKDSFRMQAYSSCMTMHSIGHYWVAALGPLEAERQPVRIAFTYGSDQVGANAFLAPFLGRNHTNRLMYVSPERDGSLVPHHPDYLARSRPSYEVWMAALRKAGATHVLSLQPPPVELRWLQEHPREFVSLAGQVDTWGLFRIERPNL